MKWIIFALIAAFMLHGCSGKTVYVDRVVEVNVPVKCKTKEVQPAKSGVNDAETLADIIRERDELREAKKECD
ncbi:hypothetical protein E0765_06015 [Sulfuricurvum sp. IAE1]|uniref:hypothetical protein n=1 Tax=Sulfuricurvum sp. IAE1 TaxID=2546102 RepID=UPI001053B4CA|nr:hypothetical protein [Sulfuricurvum sp. IAE1]TDA64267.1 hypothetical protein E0765_06015 [Sulfuricurvum sp. IAE1]